MLKIIDGGAGSNNIGVADGSPRSPIDEIVREGARAMLAADLQAEVAAYIAQFADQLEENGHRLVVRNGYHTARTVTTSAGAVEVRAPRVNDKRVNPETGEHQRFSSAILPAWCRKSPQISEVLPLLYLDGPSTGDFTPALEQFLGSGAGLSSASITRMTMQWQDEAKTFATRDLSKLDYVYLWVDGNPPESPPGTGETVPAGDDRRACRRPQGTRRSHRRLPRISRIVGRPAA